MTRVLTTLSMSATLVLTIPAGASGDDGRLAPLEGDARGVFARAGDVSAAVASPFKSPDPLFDVPIGRADLRRIKVVHTPTEVRLDAVTRKGSNPYADRPWVVGFTQVRWAFDTNGDDVVDYYAFFVWDGTVIGVVTLPDLTVVCAATPQWHGGNGYRLTFARSCIANPASFRTFATMLWDKRPYGPGSFEAQDFSVVTPEITPT